MSPLTTLFYRLCFWHRKWNRVDSWTERRTYSRAYNLDLSTGEMTAISFNKILVLEQCEYTGFERAYYETDEEGTGHESIRVSLAKIILERNKK